MADIKSLRILMTNVVMNGRSGTETVTRDLALGYLNAGHRPYVYAPELGAIADELMNKSIPVTNSVSAIAGDVDVIHGNHLNACIGVMARFPTTPTVFVCHDFTAWHDVPPKLANIHRYVAVSLNTQERLTYLAGIPETITRLVLNGVDTRRFKPINLANKIPLHALAFAKNAGHVEAIRQVCSERKIQVDFVGRQVGEIIESPESILERYDLIFASAKTAIEAMACNLPVIVCDGRGLAGMVDLSRYNAWKDHNFGVKILLHQPSVENLHSEIDRYDLQMAAEVGERVRSEVRLEAWANRYLNILQEAINEPAPSIERAASALGSHLEIWSPRTTGAWPWVQERQALIDERSQLCVGLEPVEIGCTLSFDSRTYWQRHARLLGFHGQEEWGLWTGDRNAYIRLAVGTQRAALRLEIAYRPFIPAGDELAIDVHVGANCVETWAHTWDHHMKTFTNSLLILPESISSSTVEIIFRANKIAQASDYGSSDQRRLGIGLLWLALKPDLPAQAQDP